MKKLQMTPAVASEFCGMAGKIKLFASINMGLLEKVLERVVLYGYEDGEAVCRQGEPGDSFYLVRGGALKVSVKGGFFSRARQVASLGPGDCFGEMALINRGPRSATVSCDGGAEIFVLLTESFESVARENPAFREEMKRVAAERGLELKTAAGNG